MRQIVLLLFLTLPLALPAQSELPQPEFAYCEMWGEVIPFNNTVRIRVDLGVRSIDPFSNNIIIRDADGDRINFRSRIEALRFMQERGWELVEVFTVGESASPVYMLRFPLKGWEQKAFLEAEAKALYGNE